MSENTENHTIHLLREMRDEMRAFRSEVSGRFDGVDERLNETNTRIDGLTHMMTLLAAHSGTLEDRVSALEEGEA
ncbi:hypothetical protein [Sinisalibacter aestuarii]|uniref:Uncharacterized protein n=1 Tax=Sinisalibacter aestuarii TaxID=2949426 RepID=A0ABQ5LUG5_9RHOB|nr:hypothetical protein [Sinisalibacter aestuarii]GKY88539.1 hypothetical protein STA1M1_24080 [Sinisalibacter aestuarii]